MDYSIEERAEQIEGAQVTTYGIVWDTGAIPSITTDREALERFVQLCRQGSVSPAMLPEVLDAFLG